MVVTKVTEAVIKAQIYISPGFVTKIIINNVDKANTAMLRTDIQNCFSKAMNSHSKENAPERKFKDNKKINSLLPLNSGTENTKDAIKPKDNTVVMS